MRKEEEQILTHMGPNSPMEKTTTSGFNKTNTDGFNKTNNSGFNKTHSTFNKTNSTGFTGARVSSLNYYKKKDKSKKKKKKQNLQGQFDEQSKNKNIFNIIFFI